MTKGKRSPWVYVGIGCGAFLLLCIAGAVAVIVLIGRPGILHRMVDPAAQRQVASDLLGTRDLPAGYHVFMVFPNPFISVIQITDAPTTPDGQAESWGERGFVYARGPASAAQEREFDSFLEGTSTHPGHLAGFLGRMEMGELVSKGQLTLASGGTIQYLSRRVDLSRSSGPAGAVAAVVKVECPNSTGLMRSGFWYSPDPAPSLPVDKVNFAGSAADEAELARFLSMFDLCSFKPAGPSSPPSPRP